MLSRAARLLVLAAFMVSIGMHTAVLQAVAWARMTVDFARRDTIAVSLRKTFDGRHPCPICASLKKAADCASLEAAPTHSRLGFAAPSVAPKAAGSVLVWDVGPETPAARSRAFAPDSPPPPSVLS